MSQNQNATVNDSTYRSRIAKVQEVMKEFGIQALVLEPGPAMQYLTGVRWGRSERTFAAVIPAKGDPSYVLPGFEEMRARELIHVGGDIRVWQEDESPHQKVAEIFSGAERVGIDGSVRFFVFDKIRKEAPKVDYVSAETVLKKAGVDLTPAARRR
jgi:Xaa-Pro dipeptidase